MRTLIRAILALTLTAAASLGGNINPPSGAPSPTMKTLAEVEARTPINSTNTPGNANARFRITQPGSYYLTGNLTGVAGRHGIEVVATGKVTIDLNGFQLVGVAGSMSGIHCETEAHLTVRDGEIRGWGLDGIRFSPDLSRGSLLERLLVRDNGSDGAELSGGAIVRSSVFRNNAQYGLRVGHASIVEGCTAIGNNHGFLLSQESIIRGCVSRTNTNFGYQFGQRCIVENNLATFNGSVDGGGFFTQGGQNTISGNVASGNRVGFVIAGAGNTVVRNVSTGSQGAEFSFSSGNFVAPQVVGSNLANVTNPLVNIID